MPQPQRTGDEDDIPTYDNVTVLARRTRSSRNYANETADDTDPTQDKTPDDALHDSLDEDDI